jgi:hypothetical protein
VRGLVISYLANSLTREWRKLPPMPIDALSDEEASRTAIAVADFAFSEVSREVLIQVISDHSGDAPGRPIAEIRRPNEN